MLKNMDSKTKLVVGIVAIVIVAIVVALFSVRKQSGGRAVVSNVSPVSNNKELKDKLGIEMQEPEGADDLTYGIENDSIAIAKYKKKVSDGKEMNFVLRSSYSTEDIENSIGLDVEFAYTPIMMTVVCGDESEIPVESKVALDDEEKEMRYMKALWFDNDKYYSMVTDNLVTREDFLQEVNRVIIANHISF